MSFRINSTGRKRLLREDIHIKLADSAVGQPPAFTATITLPAALALPESARVYVEPYVGSSSMRFDFGTVGVPRAWERCVMSDVDAGAAVLFRVKVVDETDGIGRILAAADGIRPENDADGNDRKPLLPLRTMDLDEEVWRLEIDRESGPTLCINNRIPGLVERLQADPLLQGAIYPEVTRQLACFILGDAGSCVEDDAEWLADWKEWFEQQVKRPLAEEDLDEDEAVQALALELTAAFSSRMKFASIAASALTATVN